MIEIVLDEFVVYENRGFELRAIQALNVLEKAEIACNQNEMHRQRHTLDSVTIRHYRSIE